MTGLKQGNFSYENITWSKSKMISLGRTLSPRKYLFSKDLYITGTK